MQSYREAPYWLQRSPLRSGLLGWSCSGYLQATTDRGLHINTGPVGPIKVRASQHIQSNLSTELAGRVLLSKWHLWLLSPAEPGSFLWLLQTSARCHPPYSWFSDQAAPICRAQKTELADPEQPTAREAKLAEEHEERYWRLSRCYVLSAEGVRRSRWCAVEREGNAQLLDSWRYKHACAHHCDHLRQIAYLHLSIEHDFRHLSLDNNTQRC